MNRRSQWALVLPLSAALLLTGCFGRKKTNLPQVGSSAEPDKLLYGRAIEDIRRGRHGIARLSLQTLINTYPDSEYLAKAKLAIADSYYKEGGKAGLLQAIGEYKDFITFFPFLPEAEYAQMQVAMAHYRQMEKPDRDRTEVRLAEEELRTFLQKYPESKLVPDAEQRLREVQEVLADGDYLVARFYYVKGSYRASGARLIELTDRYPLFSRADRALWMLADIFERAEKTDIATQYYARIVRDYPLSNLTDHAKNKLTKLGVPIPQANPVALARMQKEREMERDHTGFVKRGVKGLLSSRPSLATAARTGQPTLTPPSETSTGTVTLTPPASGSLPGGIVKPGGGTPSNTPIIEVVPTGSQPSGPATTGTPPAEGAGAAKTPPSGTESEAKSDPANPDSKTGAATDATKSADAKPTDDEKKKKEKESTSKKKKGHRKVVPS